MEDLDLHGLNVEEATSKILMALFSFENNQHTDSFIVITGKGKRTISTTFLNLIEGYDEYGCEEINEGLYIVKKLY